MTKNTEDVIFAIISTAICAFIVSFSFWFLDRVIDTISDDSAEKTIDFLIDNEVTLACEMRNDGRAWNAILIGGDNNKEIIII